MSDIEKLRALLAEARAWVGREPEYYKAHHEMDALLARINAALAEPVASKRINAHDALYRRICEDREFWENYERERDEARSEVERLKEECESALLRGDANGYWRGNRHGFAQGAAVMREAAAQECDDKFEFNGTNLAVLIRALPIPEDKR